LLIEETAMDNSTYDEDILVWSEQQASVLRSLRSRRDLPNELDLEHVAEEIEDVGRSELSAAQSLIRQILIHIIKAVSVPNVGLVMHWRSEAVGFHDDLLDRVTPSMVKRIDISGLWRRARKRADQELRQHGQVVAFNLPKTCPLGIEEIVDEEFDFAKAVAKVLAETRGTDDQV
jgi:hypothetical protein